MCISCVVALQMCDFNSYCYLTVVSVVSVVVSFRPGPSM